MYVVEDADFFWCIPVNDTTFYFNITYLQSLIKLFFSFIVLDYTLIIKNAKVAYHALLSNRWDFLITLELPY